MDKGFLRCVVFSNQADGLPPLSYGNAASMLPFFVRFLHALV